MKKFLLIIFVLLTGCSSNLVKYKNISDAVIKYYQDDNYKEELSKEELSLFNNYIADYEKNIINLNNYLIKNDSFMTMEPNSTGVYVEDGICYIEEKNIIFHENQNGHMEDVSILVCNGYYVTLLKDDVYKENIIKDNVNYNFIGYYDSDKYSFVYKDYSTGNNLIITIGDKINIELTNNDDIELKSITEFNYWMIIFILVLLSLVVIIIKKYKSNEGDSF